MTKQLIAVMVAVLIAAPAWTAERNGAPKEETIGVGGGAAIGAIAGGPIGVILGAALGGWVGDRFHRERSQRQAAEERHAQASAAADSLEGLLRGSERELVSLRAVLADEQRSFKDTLEEALEVEVYFRTAQSALDADVEERLSQVASLIAEIDDFTIIVEGHADGRGDAQYNDALSAARAASVRDVLLRSGLAPERITMRAAGETQASAADRDLDALALERRVDLTLVRPGAERRASR